MTLAAYVPHNYPLDELEPGLEETAFYDPANFTFPAGAYGCEVEVDPETGHGRGGRLRRRRRLRQRHQPDDRRGPGARRPGAGHRPGAARVTRSTTRPGSCAPAPTWTTRMPRANDLPIFAVDHSCVTPCTHNPLGVKGCGEAGAIGSPPALVNAVIDALKAGGHQGRPHRHAADARPGLGGDRRRQRLGEAERCTHSSS